MLAMNQIKESKFMPDFYTGNRGGFIEFEYATVIGEITSSQLAKLEGKPEKKGKGRPNKKVEPIVVEKKKNTPKEVYELKTLNDESFVLNVNEEYVDAQIDEFKDKLSLIKSEEYDMRNGANEIGSILMRMENRKKYPTVKDFFDEYPYTTTTKINELVKNQDHLKVGQVAQFLADMPKEAVDTMKVYNAKTQALCSKQAVFYIIADKKDFKKSDSRRDPILLAQSPFGHFWQILGAWDDEMRFLEEL